jgi:hypothetical protein
MIKIIHTTKIRCIVLKSLWEFNIPHKVVSTLTYLE